MATIKADERNPKLYSGDNCPYCNGVLETYEMKGDIVLACGDCQAIIEVTQ